ncbi:restriction endonuclease subunit S [Aliarcobacter cryaerophilus]|uniref:restriction endonuclease subunit S n=1 Tax=Aliarcobacter cryaerophilus TaxID=28198 RepID=UPI0021B29A5A|nr:restriction endonuclease subunit S [Aliarcobacter cryaerophilus]MCT7444468.1 restriction endonuclease subunit S [Aliarcobacter cryaerophilus]MCT7479092.1 restriction endonuclease subunit S [Aliarcobacter cryaerophilus]
MKDLLISLGFDYKENAKDVLIKPYTNHEKYSIEINLEKNSINFGDKIFFNDSRNSNQNITKPEDLVVLECVDRLLKKGYKPQNIILEKVYPTGHGTSGRLDILITNKDNKAFMMIECKTWGKEFDKAYDKLKKDGGQLFTYFQQDKDAQILVLYTSELINKKLEYKNEIIKIEEEYRNTSNVKDFFDRWNKVTKNNGVFNDWNTPYNYESKALTPKDLIDIKQEDSSFIFNRFMEILRHNVVSDKPNAFNKIFTLFLCKIMDEKNTKPNEQLEFQWLEGIDDHISFQKRLTDLYQKGMKEFLDKEVTDLSDKEFEEKFGTLDNNMKDLLLREFTKIRLQKNNEFAIKDVFDEETFNENAIVVKEIVELLQGYKIRYTKKQQFLSDFFELLLTTGLKQEVGQFFTPVPIAKFIIRSMPFDKIIKEKLAKGERDELLPNVIDYAVGSGHFITEAMDEIQKELNKISPDDFIEDTSKKIKAWKEAHFDWAFDYVYGIEKDYRLVKTAKVGCYLHGDGLAKVIHGDGLSSFSNTKEFKGKLKYSDKNYPQDNKKFDIVVSNPPYSVSAFKNVSKKFDKNDFELYDRLTDQSSEIEALFIERTKQLLKDGGIAGIILPSSILTGGGIYTKTREIILKYFEVIAITELGSNTFMATGTNTVVLFLRRKNNAEHINILASVNKAFETKTDITIKSIEKPLSKYISYVWENISFEDYLSLIENNPNENILNHQIYKSYITKHTINKILEIEKEKFFYFILAYNQKITLVKSGEKQDEKKFLGYEFSFRRGSEGIHAIQRAKSIDECTSLYDNNSYENLLKANSYVYSAFSGEEKSIDKSLKSNISYMNLVDMMEFSRVDFDKFISVNAKKKVKIESRWDLVKISSLCEIGRGRVISKKEIESNQGIYPVYSSQTSNDGIFGYLNSCDFDGEYVTWTTDGIYAGTCFYRNGKFNCTNVCGTLKNKSENLMTKFLPLILNLIAPAYVVKVANPKLMNNVMADIKIPLPPKDIQQKIINEIENLELFEKDSREKIEDLKNEIKNQINQSLGKEKTLSKICDMKAGKFVSASDIEDIKTLENYPCYGGNGLRGYTKTFTHEGTFSLIGRQGALCGNVHRVAGQFHATEHALVVTPFENIDTNWLYHKLKEMNLNQYATGVAQPGLSVKNLNDIYVLVPSFQEQQQIVKQIEDIENKIQNIEKELESIPTKKEEILKKYL